MQSKTGALQGKNALSLNPVALEKADIYGRNRYDAVGSLIYQCKISTDHDAISGKRYFKPNLPVTKLLEILNNLLEAAVAFDC